MLNSIEETITGLNYDGARIGPGFSDEAWQAATFVPRPGGDDGDVEEAEAVLAEAREASSGSWELVGRLWNTEWGWAERKEWVERIVRRVVVARGREPLSERAGVELR